jgi:hypothetical protein
MKVTPRPPIGVGLGPLTRQRRLEARLLFDLHGPHRISDNVFTGDFSGPVRTATQGCGWLPSCTYRRLCKPVSETILF